MCEREKGRKGKGREMERLTSALMVMRYPSSSHPNELVCVIKFIFVETRAEI